MLRRIRLYVSNAQLEPARDIKGLISPAMSEEDAERIYKMVEEEVNKLR